MNQDGACQPVNPLLIWLLEVLNHIKEMAFYWVGAHTCGRWACHTPFKPSPTGVGSYKYNTVRMVDAHMGHTNFIGPDQ